MSVCETCWAEAQLRHAGGQGDGESVTAIYEQLIEADWCSSHDTPHNEDMGGSMAQYLSLPKSTRRYSE